MRDAVEWIDKSPDRYPRLWLVACLLSALIAGGKAVDYMATRDGGWWLPLGLYDVAFAALMLHGATRQLRVLRHRQAGDDADEAGGVGGVGRTEG